MELLTRGGKESCKIEDELIAIVKWKYTGNQLIFDIETGDIIVLTIDQEISHRTS